MSQLTLQIKIYSIPSKQYNNVSRHGKLSKKYLVTAV
jgi:hypothetical protein